MASKGTVKSTSNTALAALFWSFTICYVTVKGLTSETFPGAALGFRVCWGSEAVDQPHLIILKIRTVRTAETLLKASRGCKMILFETIWSFREKNENKVYFKYFRCDVNIFLSRHLFYSLISYSSPSPYLVIEGIGKYFLPKRKADHGIQICVKLEFINSFSDPQL